MSDWITAVFFAYMAVLLVIGAAAAPKNKNAGDYILSGGKLRGFTAAISAQLSDAGGWMMMGLPGLIYAYGANQAWIAVGLLTGMILNWVFVSDRLRRYAVRVDHAMTIPEYLGNRFHEKRHMLSACSAVVIFLYFTVYAGTAFALCARTVAAITEMDYHQALAVTAGVVVVLVCAGGFAAVCRADLVHGTLMLAGVLAVPILAVVLLKPGNLVPNLIYSDLGEDAKDYLNIFMEDGKAVTVSTVISRLAWGLGCFGMPQVLSRFMAVREERELTQAKRAASVWIFLCMICACLLGVIGRAYLYPQILSETGTGYGSVYIDAVRKLFFSDWDLPIIGGILLCAVSAAGIAAASAGLMAASASLSNDICKPMIRTEWKDDKKVRLARVCTAGIGLLAFVIAWNPESCVMQLAGETWAGLGSMIGPVVLLSLYWSRMTAAGAAAGMFGGGITVLIWNHMACISAQGGFVTPAEATGISALLVGFSANALLIVLVSLVTRKPGDAVWQEFEDAKY